VGRLTFTPVPDEHRYELTSEGTFGQLVGVDNRSTAVVTPAGFARFRLTVPLRTVYRRAA
jgi:hypothetical protein